MATAFSVESSTPGVQVWNVDSSGNTSQSGNMSVSGTANVTTSTTAVLSVGSLTATGVIIQDNGINSSGSVNVLSTLLIAPQQTSGTQIGDITRDYMCYVTCTAGGANNTLTIGSVSGGTSATIFANATMATGTSYDFRLPAGWYIKFNGTGTLGSQAGISC
jgi:hypothetical protein